MRRFIFALAFMLAGMLAGPAYADPPEGEPTAASGSLALELISQANAQGVFEALSSPPQTIIVRHPRSGLTCRMDVNAANRLLIFPHAARGEDVACESSTDDRYTTLYATRFSVDAPLDALTRGVEAAIRQRHPDARAIPATTTIHTPSLPPHQALHFLVNVDGQRYYTHASLAQIDGWTIKLRYTAPAPDDEAIRLAQLTATLSFQAALSEIAEQHGL